MLRFVITSFILLLYLPLGSDIDTTMLQMEDQIDFCTNKVELENNKIQMFVGLLDKNLKVVGGNGSVGFDFYENALPFDIFDYWQKKGNESYYVLLTKVAYVIDKDVSFFNEGILTDEALLKEKMPDYHLKKTGLNQFHMDCGFMAPSFNYKLSFYHPPFKDVKILELQNALNQLNPELQKPIFTAIQHNYDYSRVMMHKTSKMSVCVSSYYPYGNGRTLEVNYTLNYIYDLPPNLLGGHKLLIKEIKEGITSLIYNTRRIYTTL